MLTVKYINSIHSHYAWLIRGDIDEEAHRIISKKVSKGVRVLADNLEVLNATPRNFTNNNINRFTPSRFDHVY